MTAAPALADVWADLVAGDAHAYQALDEAMQRLGCDRDVALAALHGAAAEWLDPQRPSKGDGNGVLEALRRCYLRSAGALNRLLHCYEPDRDLGHQADAPRWLTWRDLADKAIALCRSLAAVP